MLWKMEVYFEGAMDPNLEMPDNVTGNGWANFPV